jgi:hypothetical protein
LGEILVGRADEHALDARVAASNLGGRRSASSASYSTIGQTGMPSAASASSSTGNCANSSGSMPARSCIPTRADYETTR